jgi:hypothetical protein
MPLVEATVKTAQEAVDKRQTDMVMAAQNVAVAKAALRTAEDFLYRVEGSLERAWKEFDIAEASLHQI